MPERVVAIRRFADAIVEPVVRKTDRELRTELAKDGLVPEQSNDNSSLLFAQYDAVFSMGERRSEVHTPLKEGSHPW